MLLLICTVQLILRSPQIQSQAVRTKQTQIQTPGRLCLYAPSSMQHSRPEIIHFPSPSGISIDGSHGGDRGVHGLMVFKKAPRIVTSVPLIVSLQLCYRSWRRFKEACTAWWSSRKRHLQACLQSVRCSVQENAKHHRLCAIVSDCVLHFKLTEGSTKPYDC